MRKIVNRPGSLIDRPPANRNNNFVDDKIALIDQQLASSHIDGDEESKKSDDRPSFSGNDKDNKPNRAVLRRISRSLKDRRKSNDYQEPIQDPIHIACFKGNFLRITDLISKDPSLVNRVYNLNDGPLLSSGEADDPSYLPPHQVPKTIRAAVASAVNNLQAINRDQKWLIDNSFQHSSLLHFACVSDQREVVLYLLDQNIDVNLRNDAQKTAEFYTISDEIKELIISERKRRQRLSQMPTHHNAAITDYVNEHNSDPNHNGLAKEHGNKILKISKRSSDFHTSPPLPQSPPPPPVPPKKEEASVAVGGGGGSGDPSRFARFEKMRSMLPEGAVRQKMSLEGFSDSEIEAFFNNTYNNNTNNTTNSTTPTTNSRLPPPPPMPPARPTADVTATSTARPRAPPPPPTNPTTNNTHRPPIPPNPMTIERSESKASDVESNDGSMSDNRSSRRLSARRLSRVLSSRRMSDTPNTTNTSLVRDSDATVSDITSLDSVTGDAKPKPNPSLILKPSSGSASHKTSELPPRPRPAPPPPMKTPMKGTPSRQRSDTPPDSPPMSPPSDDDDVIPSKHTSTSHPQKRSLSSVLFNEDLLNQARSSAPPPPPAPPSSQPTEDSDLSAPPLALHRPPLAMRRLSVAPRSNELVTVLTESDVTTGEVRVTEKTTETITEYKDLTSVDKASLPTLNNNLPTMKPFKRKSILDNLNDYLPSTTSFTPPTNNTTTNSRQPSVASTTSHSITVTSAPSSSTAQKTATTTTSAPVFNYNELTKEEKVVFHYLNLEKMLLKLVPLEDIANRVLIENAENDDVMMKKIIENPKHFLNKMSNTLAHIRLVTSDPSSPSNTMSTSPKTAAAATTSRLLSSGTTTETLNRLTNASPDKKLLAKHMIPTTVLATSAHNTSSQQQQQQQNSLTFREMLWKRAADYMNRGVFDSTGPEFHRLRHEAYDLGVKLLQQEFKTLANRDHWESIDLVQKKTIHTILSLKHNLDQSNKSRGGGGRGSANHNKSSVTSQLHRDRNISFDDIFENHHDATSLLRKVNRLSRQNNNNTSSTTPAKKTTGQRHVSVLAGLEDDMAEEFGADYYDYDIEEELEKLRMKFDQSDYDVFDVGRGPPPPPPPPRSSSSAVIGGGGGAPQRSSGKGGGSGSRIPSSLFPRPPSDEREDSLDNVEMSMSGERALNYPYDRSIVDEDEITKYFQAITD